MAVDERLDFLDQELRVVLAAPTGVAVLLVGAGRVFADARRSGASVALFRQLLTTISSFVSASAVSLRLSSSSPFGPFSTVSHVPRFSLYSSVCPLGSFSST